MIAAADIRDLFDYYERTGDFVWKPRALTMFPDERAWKIWNTKNAGKLAGWSCRDGYTYVTIGGRGYLLHRVAFAWVHGRWPKYIDHINGRRSDNRIGNLREVSNMENAQNARRSTNNTSGVTGVNYCKRDRVWSASIRVNYKRRYLGTFRRFEDAVEARQAAEKEMGFHANHGRAS
jgi:hypothetical protein